MKRAVKFDRVILNARIVDGTCDPWFYGDVGVRRGKVDFVGSLRDFETGETIDAGGKVLTPGFIDMHTHYDLSLLRDPVMISKLIQGVTTIGIGQCGLSPAPISDVNKSLLDQYMSFIKAGVEPDWGWNTFDEWLEKLEELHLGLNVFSFVGHGTVRLNVLGFQDRSPNKDELAHMKGLVARSMEQGAFGMTSGLIYPPGVYADPEEIREVCEGLREFRGLYLTHMRNEGVHVLRSVMETLMIGKANSIPVHILHLKVMGSQNRGVMKDLLHLLHNAREEGMDVTADVYPYTATSTTLRAMLPAWIQEGGLQELFKRLEDSYGRRRVLDEMRRDWQQENSIRNCDGPGGVLILHAPATPEVEGKNLEEAGKILGLRPLEAVLEIVSRNEGKDTAAYFNIMEDDMLRALGSPQVMIASDSLPVVEGGRCHPRSNGTFPRIFGRYVREKKVISLEQAVWKITGFPASRLGLSGKGLIREGMDADMVLFDPEKIIDRADFDFPSAVPEGIERVFIAGETVVKNGEFTGPRLGRVLRKRQY